MNIRLHRLVIKTHQSIEEVRFSPSVTFLYGPVSTGKSTVARLVDYCFGGELERTPAIQSEFVSVVLTAVLGDYECVLERGDADSQAVRVTWSRGVDDIGSVSAPLVAGSDRLVQAEVFNLSDLLFHLCGVEPIKVFKRRFDPDSPMIRLSFRDIWWYCYLDQTHLDSSFFRLEESFKRRKSQDAMRFFTGLHSERLSQLQAELYKIRSEQQGARQAVAQIRQFISRFKLGSELELMAQIEDAQRELRDTQERKQVLEADRTSSIHPTDGLRNRLRILSGVVADLKEAVAASESSLMEQEALRAELITAKVKAGRAESATRILGGVDYLHCPQCGSDVSGRPQTTEQCRLCGSASGLAEHKPAVNIEVVRRELIDRIDQLEDSIRRRGYAVERSRRELQAVENSKRQLDAQLQDELRRYDSAFVENIRILDREIATLEERLRALAQLQEMPRAVSELEEQAGAAQGQIDRLRSTIDEERLRLRAADENVDAIAERFRDILVEVGFPGMSDEDEVVLDPRNWEPVVVHDQQEWGFWDAGSGGKKTLFNVCYALAVHEVARQRGLPVPNLLIIDSPTKNISEDKNPELVGALYREIYRIAALRKGGGIQLLLIDSDLVEPEEELPEFTTRFMAGDPEAPSLIPYYKGP